MRPTNNYQRAIGYGKRFARVATNAGRRASRSILYAEKSEHQQEADLQKGQMLAELKRSREIRTKRRNELMRDHKHKIDAIQTELRIIIKRMKERGGIKAHWAIEHPVVLERLAINLFENLEGKTEFVTQKNPANINALGNILMSTEQTVRDLRINPNKISGQIAEQIEGTINQSIQQTFEQLQQQGQM